MKKFLLFVNKKNNFFKLITLGLISSLFSTAAYSTDLTLEVNDVLSTNGKIVIRIYDKKTNWMSDKPDEIFLEKSYLLAEDTANNKFQTSIELPIGEYSLYLFQDKDLDSNLKSNWIGIPKEPVGTSNNAKGFMGPPKYEDAKFVLSDAPLTLSINLVDFD